MTRMKPTTGISALALLVALSGSCIGVANAQESGPDRKITKVGTTSAQFLKLGVGARAISMGGSYAADASDLSALYWNPAGLSQLQGSSVQLAYTEYLVDVTYNYAAFGVNLGGSGTIAASIILLNSGDMKVRTTEQPEGTGELFDVQDMALQLSYGRALTDRFSIGSTVKYIRESVWHSAATAFAVDFGVLFTTPYQPLKLGASISNFGPKMQMSGRDIIFSTDPDPENSGGVEVVNSEFLTDKFDLPLLFRIGLSWDAFDTRNHRFRIVTDASHPNDNSEYVNIGGEYTFRNLISFRGGYRNLLEEDGEKGLTLGAGLNFRIDRSLRARFDYAYADFGRLETTHWFTVDLQF